MKGQEPSKIIYVEQLGPLIVGGDKRVVELKQIGNITPNPKRDNPQTNRVYDKEGLSPTLSCMEGGNLQPMIVASRGRNPNNLSDRTPGNPTEQRLEPNSEGICNTLTTVQKDNMVLEPSILQSPRGFNKGGEHQISPTITSNSWECNNFARESNYRIRKLTPLECWRLMGFSDEDFFSAMVGSKSAANEILETYPNHHGKRIMTRMERIQRMSNSQLYKQAGNSIVVSVLEGIFKQMI